MTCDALPRRCAKESDEGGTGEPETIFWDNTSPSTVTVFISVDAWREAKSGTFTLTTSLE